MEKITLLQLKEADLDKVLDKKLSQIQKQSAFSKFYHKLVSTSVVCEIHDVTNVTVSHWVRDRKLTPVNLGSGKHLFRLSEVLEGNFKNIRVINY